MTDFSLAEKSVIGCIVIDSRCLDEVRSVIPGPECFQLPDCAKGFEAACRLEDAGKPVDPVTVQRDSGVSPDFIRGCMEITPTCVYAGCYAASVVEGWTLRQLGGIGEALSQRVLLPSANAAEALNDTRQKLEELAAFGKKPSEPGDSLSDFLRYRQEVEDGTRKVLRTGFPSLDAYLGALSGGGLYVIGARTSVGKSAFAIALGDMIAARNRRVLYVSMEMTTQEIDARRIAAWSESIPSYSVLLHGKLTQPQQEDMAATAARLSEHQMQVCAMPRATVSRIAAQARSARAEVVIVDYLGLISGSGGKETEYERVTKASMELKRLAQSMNCVVIALCQINREAEQFEGLPKLSQLRSSGAIEQDADAVVLLHRPQREEGASEPFTLIVAKNRHGRTGRTQLTWYPAVNRFEDQGSSGLKRWDVKSWK